MCWIGEDVKQIAKENIPIFKICCLIDGQIISLYQKYPYNLNMPYYSEIHIEETGLIHYMITKGLHSYHPKVRIWYAYDQYAIPKVRIWYAYNQYAIWGLHGTVMCTTDLNIIKVIGYIPKGSVYYLNYRGEYVSDKLVLTEIANIYG